MCTKYRFFHINIDITLQNVLNGTSLHWWVSKDLEVVITHLITCLPLHSFAIANYSTAKKVSTVMLRLPWKLIHSCTCLFQ